MAITRELYLRALEVVDMYHLQRANEGIDILDVVKDISYLDDNSHKTPINQWLDSIPVTISTRLKNALKSSYTHHPEEKKFEYVEDINKNDFDKIRNSGEVTWNELKSLIETYKPVPRGIYYLPTKDSNGSR